MEISTSAMASFLAAADGGGMATTATGVGATSLGSSRPAPAPAALQAPWEGVY